MLNFLVVTIIFIILMAAQVYFLSKEKKIKEIVLSITILSISLFYCYNNIFMWDIPSSTELITKACDPIAKLIFGDISK